MSTRTATRTPIAAQVHSFANQLPMMPAMSRTSSATYMTARVDDDRSQECRDARGLALGAHPERDEGRRAMGEHERERREHVDQDHPRIELHPLPPDSRRVDARQAAARSVPA